MLKLALRNLLRQRTRTGLTLAAIVFGVVGLVLSGGFVRDIYVQLGEAVIHSQSGHLQIAREGFFTYGSRKPDEYLIDEAETVAAAVAAHPAVSDVMARVVFSGLVNNGRADVAVAVQGVEPESEAKLGTHVTVSSGRRLGKADTYAIMLGRGVADALQLGVGDQVALLATMHGGGLNMLDFEVVGTFQTFSRDFDARAAQIPLETARELLDSAGVNTLVATLDETRNTGQVAAALRGEFAGQGLELLTWPELNDFYSKTVTLYETQFGGLRLIILVMVLLSVANSVNMGALERLGEFGTMMALGNRHVQILKLIVLENALLGLIGAAIGVLAGVALAWLVSRIGIPMPPPPNADIGYVASIRIVPAELVLAFLVGFVATVVASLVPARRLYRTPVIEALRQNI